MTKELKVLAACVDSRTGKRFAAGEIFDPAPTEEQAKRLFRAGCLPEAAIEAGRKADTEAEKKAELDAKARADADAKAAAIAAATDEVTLAKGVLAEADEAAKVATSADDKAKAGKAVSEAKAALKKAEDALDKLTK